MTADELAALSLGDTVVYADANATVTGDAMALITGLVNGEPLMDDDGDAVLYVPVFSERDNGREATTVFVAAENIIERKALA